MQSCFPSLIYTTSPVRRTYRTVLSAVLFAGLSACIALQAQVTTTTPSLSFGTVAVGAVGKTQTLTFNFSSSATLNAKTPVQVLTLGAANLDFKNVGTGTCAAKSYAASSTCTVNVYFKPTLAGQRIGGVLLQDASGNSLATAYIYGTGQGPQIVYDPGIQTTLASGLSDPRGIAIDGYQNIYIADFGNGQILKVTPTRAKTVVVALSGVNSLALDGAGNLYTISGENQDGGNIFGGNVYKVSITGIPSIVYYSQEETSGNTTYTGVALDGLGNLFIADDENEEVHEISLNKAVPSYRPIAGGFASKSVAVDSTGNLFIVDSTDWLVWKYTPSGGWSTVGTGYNRPQGIAIDIQGNVYVADFGNNRVVKVTPAGIQSTVGTGLIEPTAVTVDGSGNIYIADFGNNRVVEINRSSSPALTFVSTTVGKVSTDSPKTVTLDNIGNASLTFPVPTSGKNASLSTNFALGNTTTCPELSPTSAVSTLAAGSKCNYLVSFAPTASGTISGSLVVTDSNLNLSGSKQTIPLMGAATAAIATVKLTNLTHTFNGNPAKAEAISNPSGLKVSITYDGKTAAPTEAGSYAVLASVNESGYAGSARGTLTIAKAASPLAWSKPSAVPSGTPLGSKQLNAKSTLPGKFEYSPAAGTKLAKGVHTLKVTFTPRDALDHKSATGSVEITVE